jgi:ribosomal protein S18 acetylase RimI-like enzyme
MMKIRLASIYDLEALHEMVQDITRHLDEQKIPQWDEIYPNKLILKDDIGKHQMYVVELETQVAACIVLNEDQAPEYSTVAWRYPVPALVVHRLSVHPAFQRQGIAMLCMDFAEKTAAEEGYGSIRLDAFTMNPAAFTLYENRGYRKAGIVMFRKGEFYCYEKDMDSKRHGFIPSRIL